MKTGYKLENTIKNFKEDAVATFKSYKTLAERALDQVDDKEFFKKLDSGSNSIAIIVKHIAGNQKSRFTDFLTTDGEKPDRNRDGEFECEGLTRDELMKLWDEGWRVVLRSVGSLGIEDFEGTVTIRGEKHTVGEALNRQLTHYAYHIGQIAFLAKHFRSEEWKTLSVPKNRSNEFNAFLKEGIDEGVPKRNPLDGPLAFTEREE